MTTHSISPFRMTTPGDMECVPQPVYRHRADGKPGREITLNFKDARLLGKAQVEVAADGRMETTELPAAAGGAASCRVLLPAEVGTSREAQVSLTLRQGNRELKKTLKVPAMRYWTVFIYPHSHVDIGYTAPLKIIEFIHKRNIDEGIKLAEATKDFPLGSRYRWNPEITWPVERLWQTQPEQRPRVLQAIRDGRLCMDASYLNLNTSVCSDEELFHAFRFSRELQKLTGVPMDTLQQMDVPGFSWGLVPVMAQEGVRYIMAWPNSDRAGNAHNGIDQRPFWWVGPDGKSKVLFLQPGGYGNSGSMGKGGRTGRPWFGQRDADKIPAVIKTGNANVNFTRQLTGMENANHPYDFLVLSWCLWDNCPLDADVPDAVKAWNEQYAYPHLVIAGGHEIMASIEKKYGDQLPVVRGDYTEYWTDGLGSAARLTANNRNAKEKLTQAETLWTMLHPGKSAPRSEFDEAWRCIALGSEHTWCAENPTEPFFHEAIWKAKQDCFRQANDRTQDLFDEAMAPATDKSNGALGPAEGPATGELVFLTYDVPAFGSRHYRVVKDKCPLTSGCKLDGTTLENQHLRVTLDPATGNISQLVNLATGRNFADAKVNGGLNAFRWLPANRDEPKADTDIAITPVESGPVVVELRVSSKATGCRAVTRSVRLVAGQPWVEISNVVDKLPLVEKDGIHFGFGFDIPQGRTRVDIPWGVMEMEKDQWPQANRNWIAMQRWLDLSNDKDGVTWCSLDTSLFESGAMTANIALGWGSNGPWLRKLEPSSTVYSWAMNNHWHTNFPLTQDGPVTFRYRILPHGAYDAAAANRFGLEQAQALAHVAANTDPKLKPLIAVDNQRVCVTILKPGADGKSAIIRLRSLSDKAESVRLAYPGGAPQSVRLCAREETPGEPAGATVSLLPYGLLTLRAEFN